MRFFSVIFPTWGCTGVLLKVEKNPYGLHSWYFPAVLCLESTFGVLEHWKIPKGWWGFPPPNWLFFTFQLLNHRRNHQRKTHTKGQGSLNRNWRMFTGDLPLQYKCQATEDHTESQLDIKRGTTSFGEVSGRLSWRSVTVFFSVWFQLLVTCPFLCGSTEGYHYPSTYFAPWEHQNLLRNVRTVEESATRAIVCRKTSHEEPMLW